MSVINAFIRIVCSPAETLPERPALCFAEALEISTVASWDPTTAVLSIADDDSISENCRSLPESITILTSGIVKLVSAMLVERMIFGPLWKTCACSLELTEECNMHILARTFCRLCWMSLLTVCISSIPGRKHNIDPSLKSLSRSNWSVNSAHASHNISSSRSPKFLSPFLSHFEAEIFVGKPFSHRAIISDSLIINLYK